MASLAMISGIRASSYFLQNSCCFAKSSIGSFIPHQLVGSAFVRMSSSKINRGDIFIIQHPRIFEQGDIVHSKDSSRPGLIVSSNAVIAKTDHIVLANITKNISSIYPFEAYIKSNEGNGLFWDSKVMTNHLYTLPKKVVADSLKAKKIGALNPFDMEEVNHGLRMCLSSIRLKTEPKFSRGTVVETYDNSGNLVYGVIVSNDIGNLRSRIVILSPARHSTSTNEIFQVDIQVKNDLASASNAMRVDCNEINSAPQSSLKAAGKISEFDLKRIESRVLLGLGLDD